MKPGKLLTLAVVTALLVAAAVWSSRRQRAAPPSVVGTKLLPKLELASVARVEIARHGTPIRLERGADGWTVSNLFGYPANVGKLQDALLKLADLKIGEVARGVNIDTNATLVDVQDAAGKPLVSVCLNDARPGAEERFGRGPVGRLVTVAGNPQVYRVKDPLYDFDGEAREWVNSQILSLPSADIQTIQTGSPTGQVLTFSRESGALQLQGVSTNEEFDTGKSYGIESAFQYFNFAGIADPKLDRAQTGLATPARYVVKLKNGDEYVGQIGAAAPDGNRYFALSFTLAPAGTNAAAVAEYRTRKAELDQKTKWAYLIAATTAENMTPARADLVKPRKVETNSTATATAPLATP